jgi:hypothetical protein
MSAFTRSLLLIAATAVTSFASTVTFARGDGNPNTIVPDLANIIGNALDFQIFGVQLSQPTMTNPDFQLTIETNYGFNDLPNSGIGVTSNIPNGSSVIPSFPFGGLDYNIGDFIIQQGGNDYGILLSAHDGYTQAQVGSLFEVNGYQGSADLLPVSVAKHEVLPDGTEIPVELAPGGRDLSLSGATLTVTTNPDLADVENGTQALYTITVNFSAPAGFLDDQPFTIDFTSAICANDFIVSMPPPVGPSVPEPGTWALMASGLLLLGIGLAGRKIRG